MRWWLIGVGAALVVLAGVAVYVRYVVLDDTTTIIGTADALDDFREQSTTVAPTEGSEPAAATTSVHEEEAAAVVVSTTLPVPPTSLVEPGVYEFATTGFERIDAVGGTRHDYPETTTMTVLADGCGVSVRWDALKERWDKWSLCSAPEGIVLQPGGVQFHEFYGMSEREKLRCDRSVLLVPVDHEPRPVVEQTCALASEEYLPTWKVMGSETRTVDGEEIEVQHVRMRLDETDDYWEQVTVDWYLADNGLPVEVVHSKESLSDTFVGDVHYEEEFHLVLRSTAPLR